MLAKSKLDPNKDYVNLLTQSVNHSDFISISYAALSLTALQGKDMDDLYFRKVKWRDWCIHPKDWGSRRFEKDLENYKQHQNVRYLYNLHYNAEMCGVRVYHSWQEYNEAFNQL